MKEREGPTFPLPTGMPCGGAEPQEPGNVTVLAERLICPVIPTTDIETRGRGSFQ